ncbi:Lysophosphatidic acid:oleoyl-CoA acyltransferase 1 [Ophidiomyces ophidiicola]|nr:Lysophosphatidic acid:oleoyl-CoA acyltransferase 1 [Ophidiomyces ophidiicola]
MEKYSQFRDRGSGIAPFLPVSSSLQPLSLAIRATVFVIRLPLIFFLCSAYFGFGQWLPIGALGKKFCLWAIAAIGGVWWIDLHIDGVKKGSLACEHPTRLPHPGTIIASSFTSPIDSLYLAAVFDPVFTVAYPSTPKIRRISLLQAITYAFSFPETGSSTSNLTDLPSLLQQNPNRCIVVFPECTTTNGQGILELSPCIASAPRHTKIFAVNLRYTPADITTPIPRSYLSFIWNLLSQATHCIRVRIAEPITIDQCSPNNTVVQPKVILNLVGDTLATLGRIKRVGLGVKEKQEFLSIWFEKKKVVDI